jgi:hypothetical protein
VNHLSGIGVEQPTEHLVDRLQLAGMTCSPSSRMPAAARVMRDVEDSLRRLKTDCYAPAQTAFRKGAPYDFFGAAKS